LRKIDIRSPEAVVRFAKSNPAVAENKIIDFLSSERGRDDRGEISADTINNWVKATRLFQIEAVSYTVEIQYCYLGILVVNLKLSGILLAHW
jgi:hypothetical protein